MTNFRKKLFLILIGALCGIANGFFGGGGGMIIVPLFTFLLKENPKVAHATAIAVILPVSVVSAVTYLIFGKFDVKIGLSVSLGVAIGGAIGAFMLKKISANWLVKIFAFVMFFTGIKLMFF